MTQVDLETIVSACAGGGAGDNKISCETLAAQANDDDKSNTDLTEKVNPDFPPESFWLSKDAEFDWFDRNAFYVRSESTKGNANSANLYSNLIQNTDPHSNSGSQRFSGTLRRSKAAVIGLPKPQKFMDSKNRRNCKTAKPRLFPKRSGSVGGKANSQVIEPSSPNVSCMGRVRSKRDRNRRFRTRQRSKSNEAAPPVKPAKPARRKRDAFFSTVRAIFRSGKRSESASSHNAPSRCSDSSNRRSSIAMSRDIRERLPPADIDEQSTESSLPRRSVAESESSAIGLGGMKRFVSGRRPDLGQ